MTSSFILIHKKYFYFIAFDISITNLSKQKKHKHKSIGWRLC
jgi:hypothetical protein